ncbi:hypothetical protein COLU111180_06345 [Cohnella lubricantis]|uniref:Uncharacterized protein n=1 Tax=Cohnella lubricantis TaxID=2163172 RepID=A0A841TGB3_9BACL|nr:hypothetical protein [Cohnella lubricantis]MBB6677501.1 hypothetical protein [Cohnella lubricantis]MBP2116613.1 hypothetical protein [Cohnella lubricantis]
MTRHDQARRDALVKTLVKAKEQAETAALYLTANDRDPEDIMTTAVVIEHIDIALEQLGALVPQ